MSMLIEGHPLVSPGRDGSFAFTFIEDLLAHIILASKNGISKGTI